MAEATDVAAKMRGVSALAVSADGVLTDAGLSFGDDGRCQKRYSARDVVGLQLARAAGWKVVVLSDREDPALRAWAAEAGQDELREQVSDPLAAVREWAQKNKLEAEQVAFIGGELLDLPAMKWAGLGCAPGDAALLVRKKADLVLDLPGGRGAVRELVERALDAQQRTCEVLRAYYVEHGVADDGGVVERVEQEQTLGSKIGFRR